MIVTTDFWHDRRVRKEAKTVLDGGYKLTVIAARRPEDNIYESSARKKTDPDFDTPYFNFKPVNISKRLLKSTNIPLLGTLDAVLWASNGWFKFISVIWKVKADLYHCHDIDSLALAYLPARKHKGIVIFDCHDIFSDIQVKGSILEKLRPIWRLLEKTLPKKADGVIAAANRFAMILEERSSVPEHSIVRVYNTPYLHPLTPQSIIHSDLNLQPDIKVALYLGSVNLDRGLDVLLNSVNGLDSGIVLAIYGAGHSNAWNILKERITRLNDPSKVKLGNFVQLDDVPAYLMSADISLIPNTYLSAAYDSLPNKFFEGLMAGKPLVTNKLPDMSALIEEIGCGIVCDNADPKTYARAINQLMSNESLRKKMGKSARAVAEKTYNWDNEAKKIESLYTSIFNK